MAPRVNIPELILDFGDELDGDGIDPATIISKMIKELKKRDIVILDDNGAELRKIPVLRAAAEGISYLDVKALYTKSRSESKGAGIVSTKEPRSITFRMQTDSMYVIGFKGDKHNRLWEFRDDKCRFNPLFPGSEDLGMNGSYSGSGSLGAKAQIKVDAEDLTKGKGKEAEAWVDYRTTVTLNRENTFVHLEVLRDYEDGEDRKVLAQSLIYLIQLLAEMVRLKRIGDFVSNQWSKDTNNAEDKRLAIEEEAAGVSVRPHAAIARRLPKDLVELENKWEKISKAIQQVIPDTENAPELQIVKHFVNEVDEAESSRKGKKRREQRRRGRKAR